ncbi:MAG: indolepyruvate ferredoxin oxidoreductase family protein [Hyphomicrobiaceae bacterium]|nr:indolepyruvate ferredoxin oxidoreductase family protein [Hyphomicrobiaceae bacterium]
MTERQPSLADKFDLAEERLLLNGMQAVVRLALMQKARDRAAGLDTAGYVTGYRGSPIATIEQAFAAGGAAVAASDIVFHPAVNEELAATALWGAQQAELRGEGRFDGVFGIWYGKGPGVDRSGDALRHANHAGTSRHGGVIALMGDDHTCESSTSAHQSEFAFIDAMIPILAPGNVEEIIDYGLIGFALSRYAGTWVGLKCVKETAESTGNVDGRIDRVRIVTPGRNAFMMPEGGLGIRLGDTPLAKEARLIGPKQQAILAFARANGLDRTLWSGGPHPRIGILTAGKSTADVREALALLGIEESHAHGLGIAVRKIAMTWPLEPEGLRAFADGLACLVVIEEKRAIIEPQVKTLLYGTANAPIVVGKSDERGQPLLASHGGLDAIDIARVLAPLIARYTDHVTVTRTLAAIEERIAASPAGPSPFERTAYFCAGCPHNTSTRVPDGMRAYAGIGCHYMAQWMDRATDGFTQMGGEGANWIGEAPFSTRAHMLQNIGDGTFVHSGSLAIRAAVAAGTPVTFKILYNDAVAMTGGQKLEGDMTVAQMAAAVLAEGAARVTVVAEEPHKYRRLPWQPRALPGSVAVAARGELQAIERSFAASPGVSVIIYDQTCAAEKRRRRKRGTMPPATRRVFINPLVCEGCGDCGKVSNCVAILPLETEFGRKRMIDQSACNADLSCLDGLCPSFVTVDGQSPLRKAAPARVSDSADSTIVPLPEPARASLGRPLAVLATGIGGTGVVTISAVLGQAAHLAGLGFGSIDVTGIAQKGGAVLCHMRFAARPGDVHAIRVPAAGADVVIGGDLVVTASSKVLDLLAPGHTAAIVSSREIVTGRFTAERDLAVPGAALRSRIEERLCGSAPVFLDAQGLAVAAFGDSLYANMLLVGLACQQGHLPMSPVHIETAIRHNGADPETNIAAFTLGRRLALDVGLAERLSRRDAGPAGAAGQAMDDLAGLVAHRERELVAYQDEALARLYRARIERVAAAETAARPGSTRLALAAAPAYFRVLAVKDEYEVARLYTDGRFAAALHATFEAPRGFALHLAPPVLDAVMGGAGQEGRRPRKLALRSALAWPMLTALARLKRLRGGPVDPFARTAERRRERAFRTAYENALDHIAAALTPSSFETAVAIAQVADEVRGFGAVKLASLDRAEAELARLLHDFRHVMGDMVARAAAE